MNEKRGNIVRKNLSYDTIPRATEWRKFQPGNLLLGRANDGRYVDYQCFGGAADFDGIKAAFTIEEFVNLVLHTSELFYLLLDASCAVERRDLATVSFYDFSGGSIGSILNFMECESSAYVRTRTF